MKTKILFRPSELSSIMVEPRGGKSNAQKMDELEERRAKYQEEYDSLKNKETKKAEGLLQKIEKVSKEWKELEPLRDLPHLSEGTKTYLRSKMIEIKYGRRKSIETKYMTKGKECEEEAITLYSLIKNKVFENNKERLENEFFSGEIDLPWRNKAGEVEQISDIKNSYDIWTFFDNLEGIKKPNYWQGIGYMSLYPSCKRYHIANVLVDNTDDAILTILHRESYKWENGDTPAWRELEIIKEHIYTEDRFTKFITLRGCVPHCEQSTKVFESFVEMPRDSRLIEHSFNRSEEDISKAHKRIEECRLYMKLIFGLEHCSDERK